MTKKERKIGKVTNNFVTQNSLFEILTKHPGLFYLG